VARTHRRGDLIKHEDHEIRIRISQVRLLQISPYIGDFLILKLQLRKKIYRTCIGLFIVLFTVYALYNIKG